jgi:arsenate reductase
MAEGWCRHLKSDVIEPYSAGIAPRGLDRLAVKVMAEAGVDISGHHSKHPDELKDVKFDYVITLCDEANEYCPMFPGKAKITHIGFDDPPKLAAEVEDAEEKLNCYRRVRDKIKMFILGLPESIKVKWR